MSERMDETQSADTMKFPKARVLIDSSSYNGDRITTMEVTFHRFVLSEFNTHRAFSRNSASSRAIPVRKMIEKVRNEPAIPLAWPAEKPGMQGGDQSPELTRLGLQHWMAARDFALEKAEHLAGIGVHKSIVNRLLEPFMWHTVIVTGDRQAYLNFFIQRVSSLAQPEICEAAKVMQNAYVDSKARWLDDNVWHLPFFDDSDRVDMSEFLVKFHEYRVPFSFYSDTVCAMVSAARCARVSYLTHDKKRDFLEDLRLFRKLYTANPMHFSPMEHMAVTNCHPDFNNYRIGNLSGWTQFRHLIPRYDMRWIGNWLHEVLA